MKTDLSITPSEVASDRVLILSREPNSKRFKKLNCIKKGVFIPTLFLIRVGAIYGLAVIFILEGCYFQIKGLGQSVLSLFSSKYSYANGTENVKKAAYRFFGLVVSPLILVFPEKILTHFASDEILMRVPYKTARMQFNTWDKKRQQCAWERAIEREEKIDPKFFKFLQKKDIGNTWKKLSFRLFCQQFSFASLKGKRFKGLSSLEGLSSLKWSVSDREIYKSMQKWIKVQKGKYSKRLKPALSFFKKSLEKDWYGDPKLLRVFYTEKTEWFYCPSGYKAKKGLGHANGFIFGPNICAKIDTGPTKKPGIKFYKRTKENKSVLESTLFDLHSDTIKLISKKEQQEIFNKAKKELGLKRIGTYSWRQKSGSCSYTSSLVSVLAFLGCKELSKKRYAEKMDKHRLNKALDSVLPTFNKWNRWHRLQNLKKFMPLIEEKKNKNFLIFYLVLDCLEERDFALIQKLIKWKPGIKNMDADLLMPSLKDRNLSFGDFLEQVEAKTLEIPQTFRQVSRKRRAPAEQAQ